MISFQPNSQKIIPFNKGVNEEESALELGASELTGCYNYMLSDGTYSGLKLVDGYEVYDGTTLATETEVYFHSTGIMIETGDILQCTDATKYPAWDSSICTTESTWVAPEDGDELRRAARDAIVFPGGTGSILCVFEYNSKLWCIREDTGHKLYSCSLDGSDVTGWSTSVALGTTGTPDNPTGIYKYYKGRIANYNTNEEVVVLCNGISKPMILNADGTITTIDAGGFLPSDTLFAGTADFPYLPVIWNQRLILAYHNGHVFFNQPGSDPSASASWNPAVASAGEIYLEDAVTNMIVTPASCTITCDNMIKVLVQLQETNPATNIDFIVETFSPSTGALWDTAQVIIGTTVYCSDRGITTLEATDAIGDFKAAMVSKQIHKSYNKAKDNILCATLDRRRNQYKVFFNNGTGIIVTLKTDGVKGATFFKYSHTPACTYESSWFGGTDGGVYKVHEGAESFNCGDIPARITTSFFAYNTPTKFKSFKRILLELDAQKGTTIYVQPVFDYAAQSTPVAFTETVDTTEFYNAVPWGTELWNEFIWGGSEEERAYIYAPGIGTNMGMHIYSEGRYYTPHSLHNCITTYSQRGGDF